MKVIKGNLISLALAGVFDVVVHGCNCQCTMGAGIAHIIATEFPEAMQVDALTKVGDANKLGTINSAYVKRGEHSFWVVNAYTQLTYGRGMQVDYDAIKSAMSEVRHYFSGLRIGYPKIGAGLGGGNWDEIAPIIDAALDGEDHTLVELV